MGRVCNEVTSHWSYFGRQVACPHNFCQDCNDKLGTVGSDIRKVVVEEDRTEINNEYLPFVKPGTILMGLGVNELWTNQQGIKMHFCVSDFLYFLPLIHSPFYQHISI